MKNMRGMSLIELLLAASILSLVMLATLSLYRSGVFAYTRYRAIQEDTDRSELILKTLADDLSHADTIDFVEQYRLGLQRTLVDDNGQACRQTIVYEYRPAPAAILLKRCDYDEKVLANHVTEFMFVRHDDNAAVGVVCKIAGRARLLCTLPMGQSSSLAQPYPQPESR